MDVAGSFFVRACAPVVGPRALATAAMVVVLLSLPSASPAYEEPQVKLIDTAYDVDVLGGFIGSGLTGVIRSSGGGHLRYDLFLVDAADNEVRVNRAGTQAHAGGIEGTTVVYQENRREAHKVVLYDTVTGSRTDLPLAATAEHPTLSGAWILYADGSRRGTSSVRLYNRLTQESRRLAFAHGKGSFVYAGQVAGDWAAWGRATPLGQDVYLTSISTGQTIKLRRAPDVFAQYNPAVTIAGDAFFTRDKPCHRRCPDFNGPRARYQLVEQRLGAHPRVVANLPRGMDTGYLYADTEGSLTRVAYERFARLKGGYTSYGDLFGFSTLQPAGSALVR